MRGTALAWLISLNWQRAQKKKTCRIAKRRSYNPMRLIRVAATISILCIAGSSLAQDWIEYVDRAERFSVSLPGQPTVTSSTYVSEDGKILPARVYTAQDGPRLYSVTVVNYAGADVTVVRGSIAYAAWNFRKRGGEVTYDAFAQVDRIEGHQ